MDNIIIMTKNETFNIDAFYYNNKEHYISYHVPNDANDKWISIVNIKCKLRYKNKYLLLKIVNYKNKS